MSQLLKEQFSQVGEILSCKRSPLRGRALSDREADRQSQKLFTNVNDRKLRRYTYIPLALKMVALIYFIVSEINVLIKFR